MYNNDFDTLSILFKCIFLKLSNIFKINFRNRLWYRNHNIIVYIKTFFLQTVLTVLNTSSYAYNIM